MVKTIKRFRILIGLLLIIIPYSTVRSSMADSDFILERLLELSKFAFIPVIIGFILVWPLTKYKNNNKNINLLRLVVGTISLFFNIITAFKLFMSVSSYASSYNITLKDLYAMNANFSSHVFLLVTKFLVIFVIIKPLLFNIHETKKLITTKKSLTISDDTGDNLKNIYSDIKKTADSKSKQLSNYMQKNSPLIEDNVKKIYSNFKKTSSSKRQQLSDYMQKNNSNSDTAENKLNEILRYKELMDNGTITEEEFQKAKDQILGS